MTSTEHNNGTCRCSTVGRWASIAIILALAAGVLAWATAERRKNIMKTASELGECSTFVELVDKAGMTTVLEKDGPFTVFIPTNEAFAKIPKERLEEILNDKSALAAVLLYHMTPNALTIKDLEKPSEQTTCVVPKTNITCSQEKYGDAVCIQKNIPCVNGVVYVIDTVQIPPFLTSGQPAPPQPEAAEISIVAEEIEEVPAPAAPEKTAEPPKPAPTPAAVETTKPQVEPTPAPTPVVETAKPAAEPTAAPAAASPETEPESAPAPTPVVEPTPTPTPVDETKIPEPNVFRR